MIIFQVSVVLCGLFTGKWSNGHTAWSNKAGNNILGVTFYGAIQYIAR